MSYKYEDEIEDDDLEIHEYQDKEEVILKTHNKINRNISGSIIKMEQGYVELRLDTTAEMLADNVGLIHGGFIFSAADYAAMAAVNEKNVVLVASDTQFLSPVKLGDAVNFIAQVRHQEGRKRNVHVIAKVLDIKVFEGEFKTVVTDRHVLRLTLLDLDKESKTDEDDL